MSGSGMTDVKPPPASVGQSRVGVHEISEETLEEHRLVRAGGEYVGDEGEEALGGRVEPLLAGGELGGHGVSFRLRAGVPVLVG